MVTITALRKERISIGELADNLEREDLQRLTNEMIDRMLALIAGCTDDDVLFVPSDPEAWDQYADNDADRQIPWTLGHVIVHTTASAEESAALAAELARGVPYRGGRSRSEVPWQTVTKIAACYHRLEESRRMRLASLDMWPDEPDMENTYRSRRSGDSINAIRRFLYGLAHDDSHLDQIEAVVQQAKGARADSGSSALRLV